MKEINAILIILLILSILLITGCSSQKSNIRQGQRDYTPGGNRQFGAGMQNNLSEEDRQQMFEERQQMAIQACDGKNEGDSCQFEGPLGDMGGTCKIMDESLICTTDTPRGRVNE